MDSQNELIQPPKFRLLKSLPQCQAGEIFVPSAVNPNRYVAQSNKEISFDAEEVKNKKQWFRLIPAEKIHHPEYQKGFDDGYAFANKDYQANYDRGYRKAQSTYDKRLRDFGKENTDLKKRIDELEIQLGLKASGDQNQETVLDSNDPVAPFKATGNSASFRL